MGKKCDLQSNRYSTVVNMDVIPYSLKKLNQWICWRLEAGKKVPYGGRDCARKIDVTDTKFWLSFDVAFREHQKYRCSGIGFVLDGSGIIGIDLDNCVSEGIINPEALSLLDDIGADYVEFSPSGSGLRSFVFGTLDNLLKGTCRGVQYEIYAEKRYLTVTGNKFRGNDLASVFNLSAITPTPLASVSSVSLVSSVSSVNHDQLLVYEIPQSLLPTREGERNDRIFALARNLKARFPDVTPKALKSIVQDWHAKALPFIRTKPFEETWAEFCYGWDNVKYPAGIVFSEVMENLPMLPKNMDGVGEFGEKGDRLLQACLGLSQLNKDGVFFLSCRKAGELLGCSHTEAAKLLRVLVRRNVLEIVRPGTNREATRYRFRVTHEITCEGS